MNHVLCPPSKTIRAIHTLLIVSASLLLFSCNGSNSGGGGDGGSGGINNALKSFKNVGINPLVDSVIALESSLQAYSINTLATTPSPPQDKYHKSYDGDFVKSDIEWANGDDCVALVHHRNAAPNLLLEAGAAGVSEATYAALALQKCFASKGYKDYQNADNNSHIEITDKHTTSGVSNGDFTFLSFNIHWGEVHNEQDMAHEALGWIENEDASLVQGVYVSTGPSYTIENDSSIVVSGIAKARLYFSYNKTTGVTLADLIRYTENTNPQQPEIKRISRVLMVDKAGTEQYFYGGVYSDGRIESNADLDNALAHQLFRFGGHQTASGTYAMREGCTDNHQGSGYPPMYGTAPMAATLDEVNFACSEVFDESTDMNSHNSYPIERPYYGGGYFNADGTHTPTTPDADLLDNLEDIRQTVFDPDYGLVAGTRGGGNTVSDFLIGESGITNETAYDQLFSKPNSPEKLVSKPLN